MARLRTNFVRGTITNNPLAIGDTTLTSASLSSLPVVSSPDIVSLILDPAGAAPEIVHVTAHSASATSATILRGREGSSAKAHVQGTAFVAGPTATDFPANAFPATVADGDILYGVAASDEYQALAKPATPAGEVLTFATGASAPSWASAANAFDAVRTLFRANRRVVAEWAAGADIDNASTGYTSGIAYWVARSANTDINTNLAGEPYHTFANTNAGRIGVYSSSNGGAVAAVISPNKSPRMLARVRHPAVSANVTDWLCGFWSTNSATPDGAYLRIVTTGNVFFVTRQGGAETTTDLGVLSRTTLLGYEIETADAGVTWVCRNQAGTVLATHTTNVPTVTTALCHGVVGDQATAGVVWGAAYLRVEGNGV